MNTNVTDQGIEKFEDALKVALGADYVSINRSPATLGYDVGVAFKCPTEFDIRRPEFHKEIIQAIEKRLQKTPAYERLVTDLEASVLAANEKVKQLEAKVEDLQQYKTFYVLYKDLQK